MPTTVPASEFTRNFGRYRMRAQREPIAVSSHGQITGYFIGPDDYEAFKRFCESRSSFATAALPEEATPGTRLRIAEVLHGKPVIATWR